MLANRRTPAGDSAAVAAARQARSLRLIITAMALLALALSLYQLTRPNKLFGVDEYDDGAYFGSSLRLVNGALPYRDFVLVQPPGFALLASPLALLSRAIGTQDAFAAARLLMPLVAAANVALVGMLVRHRGQLTTMVAAGLMAVFPAEVHATHTLLLEPVLDLFCLVGVVVIFDGERFRGGTRTLLVGGLALGFAATIKGWAVIPVVVLALLCLPQVRGRLAPFLGGVALGFGVPTVPFVLVAPAAFYREVVATQLRRVALSGRIPVSTRLGDLTGSSSVTNTAGRSLAVAIVLLAIVVVLTVAAAVRLRRRPTALEVFVIACLAGVGVLLMAPSEFYDHYAAFFAPFLAMVVGGAVGVVAARLTLRRTLAVTAIAAVVLTLNDARIITGEHGNSFAATVGTIIPAGSCVLSDSADYLITTNRFISSQPGCADNVTDSYGTSIANSGGRSPAGVAAWLHAIGNSNYVVLSSLTDGRIPLSDPVQAELTAHFRMMRAGRLYIYVRNGYPIG